MSLITRKIPVHILQAMLNGKKKLHPYATSTRPSLSAYAAIHKAKLNAANKKWLNLRQTWNNSKIQAAVLAAERLHKSEISYNNYKSNLRYVTNLMNKLSVSNKTGPQAKAYLASIKKLLKAQVSHNTKVAPKGYMHGGFGGVLLREQPFTLGLRRKMLLNNIN